MHAEIVNLEKKHYKYDSLAKHFVDKDGKEFDIIHVLPTT
jgi:hypothetical protein